MFILTYVYKYFLGGGRYEALAFTIMFGMMSTMENSGNQCSKVLISQPAIDYLRFLYIMCSNLFEHLAWNNL